jgi:hypothetical protein
VIHIVTKNSNIYLISIKNLSDKIAEIFCIILRMSNYFLYICKNKFLLVKTEVAMGYNSQSNIMKKLLLLGIAALVALCTACEKKEETKEDPNAWNYWKVSYEGEIFCIYMTNADKEEEEKEGLNFISKISKEECESMEYLGS